MKKENYKDLKENESEEIKNSGSEQVPETESTEDLNQKIIELEKELNEYKDRLLRKAAEFENYKRRTENDQLNLFKYAAESFIMKLLPVIDDFERSLQYIDSSKDIESIKQGILLVYDKFSKLLEDQGVKKIESVGKPFDVHYHEALLQRTVDDQEPHIVLEELESGYMYKDRVIRHSKVIVSDDASGSNRRIKEK